VIMDHPLHVEILNTDEAILINDPTGVLMGEVTASELDALMHTRNGFAMLTPLSTAFCQLGVLTLNFCQCLLFFAEETGILDFLSIGERGKGLDPHINADLFGGVFQAFRLTFTRERDRPFARRGARESAGLDCATNGPMTDHLDRANFGEAHTVIMGDGESTLRVGDGVVAAMTLKAGVSWFFTSFHAPEKGFHGKVNTNGYVLQDLRVHGVERGAFSFQDRKGLLLLIEREALTCLLIGGFALSEQVVIEPSTLFKRRGKRLELFLRRIDPILKGFTHDASLSLNRKSVKGRTPPYPPIKGWAIHPRLKRAGLSCPRPVKPARKGAPATQETCDTRNCSTT
jgi:hypothetical protein